MLLQFHRWLLKVAIVVALFIALGGSEAFCADCGTHNADTQQEHADRTASDSIPQDCDCACHMPVGPINHSLAGPAPLVVSCDVFALEQAAPSAPCADIDRPPQLA